MFSIFYYKFVVLTFLCSCLKSITSARNISASLEVDYQPRHVHLSSG